MNSRENLPMMLSANDIQTMGFTRTMAYNILNREDVPVVKIGSRKFIQRDKFFDWLDSREKKISNLTHEIEMKNKLFNDYVVIMKKMEQCIIEKNALIAEKDKRIAELTDKAMVFDIFSERLDKLFAVFEDNANIIVRVQSYYFNGFIKNVQKRKALVAGI